MPADCFSTFSRSLPIGRFCVWNSLADTNFFASPIFYKLSIINLDSCWSTYSVFIKVIKIFFIKANKKLKKFLRCCFFNDLIIRKYYKVLTDSVGDTVFYARRESKEKKSAHWKCSNSFSPLLDLRRRQLLHIAAGLWLRVKLP